MWRQFLGLFGLVIAYGTFYIILQVIVSKL